MQNIFLNYYCLLQVVYLEARLIIGEREWSLIALYRDICGIPNWQ